MAHDQQYLKAVGEQFRVPGAWVKATPYGTGHINDTYLAQWATKAGATQTILQRINHLVFKNPPQLMENIIRVTAHLRKKMPARSGGRQTLTVIRTRDDQAYYQDPGGNYWRMYVFIKNARTVDICARPGQAYAAARAFGRFQASLADLPGARLHETIPYFHHSPRRFAALEDALRQDPRRRAGAARQAIEFCLARASMVSAITDLVAGGRLPERIAHNDTKINNVMLDNRTGRGICVIDLDTVMTGCALYDFGDMVRTMPRTAAEDERDLDRVTMDLAMFDALTRGYLEETAALLTPLEIEHLPLAGRLVTFTIGVRFLTDHLLGDGYFKTQRPDQNLDRARVQFKMMASMEQQADAMRAIVRQYAGGRSAGCGIARRGAPTADRGGGQPPCGWPPRLARPGRRRIRSSPRG